MNTPPFIQRLFEPDSIKFIITAVIRQTPYLQTNSALKHDGGFGIDGLRLGRFSPKMG
jgi:hypothetical protein